MMSITKRVYAGDPAQPSRPDFTSGAKIKVVKQRHIFFEEIDGCEPPVLDMTIRDPDLLIPKGSKVIGYNEFFERVLTSCNLCLKNTRLSTVAADTQMVKTNPDPPRKDVSVKRTPDNMNISVYTEMEITLNASISFYHTEDLDEEQIRTTLNAICSVYDDENPSVKISNLKGSLKAYSHGIVSHHKEEVFKGLFVALEKAVNFDEDAGGKDFDAKTRTLVGDKSLPIDDIREAYNRLKHHTSEKKMTSYPDDMAIFHHIQLLRPATVKAILLRLETVVV